jgi:hypothetical protein
MDAHVLLSKYTMESDTQIKGPLGIWTFPILNTLVIISNNRNREVEVAQVQRDSEGRISRVEVTKE